jgi:hypothetical protein
MNHSTKWPKFLMIGFFSLFWLWFIWLGISIAPRIIHLSTIITEPQTIFVWLMNTSEKKPFGWFFGSFIIINYTPRSQPTRSLIDSYHPQTVRNYRLSLPDYYQTIMPLGDGKIWMLWANMLWWTHDDATTIRTVYHEIYGKKLDWIILLDYTLFRDIIPARDNLTRKREFLNATVDMRRGESRANKKEDSFRDIQTIMTNPRYRIKTVSKLPRLMSYWWKGKLHLTPPTQYQSTSINQRLIDKQWLIKYQPESMYLGEYNLSFNKIDKFTTTTTSLAWPQETKSRTDISIFPNTVWQSWNYIWIHTITTEVPERYTNQITKREKDFGLTLSARERTILSLDPTMYRRLVLYLPLTATNISLEGDYLLSRQTKTDKFQIIIMDVTGIPPISQTVTVSFEVR